MITREWLLSRKHSGKYLCPECSHTRKNKHDRCLSVTIKTEGVVYYCHHCNAKGGEFYEKTYRKSDSVRSKEGNQSENTRRFKGRGRNSPIW